MSYQGWRFDLKPRRQSRGGVFDRLYHAETGRQRPTISASFKIVLAISLIFSARMSLLFLPARFHPDRIFIHADGMILHSKDNVVSALISPLWRFTQIRQAYVRESESLIVRYDLSAGTSADLILRRCHRPSVSSPFTCEPLDEIRIVIDGRSRKKRLNLSQPGYYEFDVSDTGLDQSVIWRRTPSSSKDPT